MGRGVAAASKTSIELTFYYKNIRCRERLKLTPTKSNIKYVEKLKAKIEIEIEQGVFDYQKYFPESKKFLSDTIEHKLKTYINSDYTKKTLAYSTLEGYEKVIKKHLIPTIGDIALNQLKRAHIIELSKKLDVTQKTLNNILCPLRNIMSEAFEGEEIKYNPLKNWTPKAKKQTKQGDDINPFTPDEINAILNACNEPQDYNLILFVVSSGLRVSEWIALQWDDINFAENKIHVRNAIVRKKKKGTKTNAGYRNIDLLESARIALERQKEHTFLNGGYIFNNPRTGEPYTGDGPFRKTRWKYILKRAGVTYRYPNQLRHTFATTALSKGEPVQWVSNQLGHTTWSFTTKVYYRYVQDMFTGSGEKMKGIWATNAGKKAVKS